MLGVKQVINFCGVPIKFWDKGKLGDEVKIFFDQQKMHMFWGNAGNIIFLS